MSRNLRLKPHLRRWRGKWECMGMRCTCLGDTPKEAYADWAFLEQVERDRLTKSHTSQLSRREMRDYWAA